LFLTLIIGKTKKWSSKECEGAAKAYIDATMDMICGAEQQGEEFAARVCNDCFDCCWPPGVLGTRMLVGKTP